ncbi:tetratricopeptide repeat protein [Kitasatospora sp. NPDC058162]|uniref:tetratricopeptide repeat protein n=1 Tax=Kitasatospora sp. NPDC058162 TaxID=3346362 RepID=UPI0036DDB522
MPEWWRNRSQRRAAARAESLTDQSNRLAAAGQWARVETVLRQVIRLRTDQLGPHASATVAARGELAAALVALRRYEEAEAELRVALPPAVAAQGEDHTDVRELRAVLGRALVELRRYEEAEPELRAVLPLAVAARGEDSDDVHDLRFLLGRVLIATGRPAEAEELACAVLAAHPAVDPVRLRAWRARALALNGLGRHREAAAEYTALLTAAPAVLGERHRLLLVVRSLRFQQLAVLGECDQVEQEYPALLSALPDGDSLRSSVHSARVFALNVAGRHTEAEALARKALARHPGIGLSLGLARSLNALGRSTEALQVLTDAEAETPRSVEGALAVLLAILTAQALLGLDRPDEAETQARRAVDLAQCYYHPDNHRALEAATTVGRVLAAQGRHSEATTQLSRCATVWREHFGARHPYTVAVEADLAALCGGRPCG